MGKSLALSSKKAIIHEKVMTPIRGQLLEVPVSWSFKCPYQASVINTLLSMSNTMVYSPFIILSLRQNRKAHYFFWRYSSMF